MPANLRFDMLQDQMLIWTPLQMRRISPARKK